MVEFSELPESVGRNCLEFVVGQDEVFEGACQSRKTIWHERVQTCNTTEYFLTIEKQLSIQHFCYIKILNPLT